MNSPRNTAEATALLSTAFVFRDQMKAREVLQAEERAYHRHLVQAYLENPFLRLTQDEVDALQHKIRPLAAGAMIAARDAATRMETPKYAIFCMPKSGSSFVQTALRHALQAPLVSLTSVGSPRSSSHFGMNSREQELDELAIVKASLICDTGFVARHHTRYSPYLALQLLHYGITPIVLVRNVLDSIVSFDDMMLESRRKLQNRAWAYDAQFALPLDYKSLDDAARYKILAHSYGTWLINFYLSWKRCLCEDLISPPVIRYEDYVLQPEKLVALLAGHLAMSEEQRQRLQAYVDEPDKVRSRFNVGRKGRGRDAIPKPLRDFLADYAAMFRSELSDEDIDYLVA